MIDDLQSPKRQVWTHLRRDWSFRIGMSIIAFFGLIAIFAPVIAPYDPYAIDLESRLAPPGTQYWFGTDALGRDILSRMIIGSRISMGVGLVIALVAVVIGIPVGVIAGYRRGWVDGALMRIVDVLLALPGLLLAIAIVAILGPGLRNALIAIAIVAVPSFARVARASTLRARELPYVESAYVLGVPTPRILRRHVLPNISSPLIVMFSIRAANSLLAVSSLGFLGLGAQPPQAEWGAMLSDGRPYLAAAPHVTTIPGAAIMILVLGFLLVGDAVRDALDPRTEATLRRNAR